MGTKKCYTNLDFGANAGIIGLNRLIVASNVDVIGFRLQGYDTTQANPILDIIDGGGNDSLKILGNGDAHWRGHITDIVSGHYLSPLLDGPIFSGVVNANSTKISNLAVGTLFTDSVNLSQMNIAISGLISIYALAGHNHDATYALLSHTHSTGDITGLGTAAFVDTGTGSENVPTITEADERYAATGHDHAGVYQPLDATLTALAGLNTTAGLVEQTGSDAFTKRAIGVSASTDIPTRASILRPITQTLDSTEITTSSAEQTLFDQTVTASSMGANGCAEVRLELFIYNATGANISSTFKVYWGGTAYWADTYGGHPSDSTYHAITMRVYVDNLGVTNKQRVSGFVSGSVNTGATTGEGNWGTTSPSNPFSNAQSSYPAKDTTSDQNIKVTLQLGTSSANARIKLDVARLIVIPGV